MPLQIKTQARSSVCSTIAASDADALYEYYTSALRNMDGKESAELYLIVPDSLPEEIAMETALDAIRDFLQDSDADPEITLCIPRRDASFLSDFEELDGYLHPEKVPIIHMPLASFKVSPRAEMPFPMREECCDVCMDLGLPEEDLEEWLRKQDDTFAVTLMKLIDKRGMTDAECYKKANVSRKTFWKINNDPDYRPSKATVLAFAIALELSTDETAQLLKTVGFSLSRSSKFDMIVEFYIDRGVYDIFTINNALFQYDQPCLGC